MNRSRDRSPGLVAGTLLCALATTWSGCSNGDEDATQDAGPATVDAVPDIVQDAGPLAKVFSFVVIADPHVTTPGKNHDRLVAAVAWINANAKARDIELVLILGDIAWGKGLPIARDDLAALTMTWVPIIGDNVIVSDNETQWDETFAPQLAKAAKELDEFVRAPLPVTDTTGKQFRLQNAAFSHRGLRFIGLDLNARVKHIIRSEQGNLYDFPGGTWPFFKAEIDGLGDRKKESVLMYTHIPMHLSPGGFDDKEMDIVAALTGPKGDLIYANLAGHYHFELTDEPKDAGYVMMTTDATWDDELRVRVVEVSANAQRFEFKHELVAVPWTGP